MINFYGKMFSVAELIVSGYASLASSGAQPTGSINMMSYFRPIPCPVFVSEIYFLYFPVMYLVRGPGIPIINPSTGGFDGGISTDYDSFVIPKYPRKEVYMDDTFETEEEDDYRPPSDRQKDYDRRRPRPRPAGKTDHR